MNTDEVTRALRTVRQTKRAWNDAKRVLDAEAEKVLKRLIYEAIANRMSVNEVAVASGLTTQQVRARLKRYGMANMGKSLLSQTAADALRDNAAMLGVETHEIDLMSPLAYLSAGQGALASTYSVRSAEVDGE